MILPIPDLSVARLPTTAYRLISMDRSKILVELGLIYRLEKLSA